MKCIIFSIISGFILGSLFVWFMPFVENVVVSKKVANTNAMFRVGVIHGFDICYKILKEEKND